MFKLSNTNHHELSHHYDVVLHLQHCCNSKNKIKTRKSSRGQSSSSKIIMIWATTGSFESSSKPPTTIGPIICLGTSINFVKGPRVPEKLFLLMNTFVLKIDVLKFFCITGKIFLHFVCVIYGLLLVLLLRMKHFFHDIF